MSFTFIPVESAKESEKLTQVCRVCAESVLFEELILRLMKVRVVLEILNFGEADGNLLISVVSDRFLKDPDQLGCIIVPLKYLRHHYRPKLVIPDLVISAKREISVEEDWYEKRDERLRIRCEPKYYDGEVYYAPPASLPELILSYSLKENTRVRIKNEITESCKTYPRDCAELTLQYLPPGVKGMQCEVINVRLDRLSMLVEKRLARREIKSIPVEALH